MDVSINLTAQSYIDKIEKECQRIKPLVAIHCITYNHEKYIRDALEGFLMQQTDFPFVALVHDDASTDGAAEIIREYAEKYPEIIFPILESENQYSNPHGKLNRIMRMACQATGAKYIAMCEGDDYWTDPHKLQKQVDFLESHPNCSLCFHQVNVLTESEGISKEIYRELEDKYYTANEIMEKWTVPTASAFFRMEVLSKRPINKNFQIGDNVLWLTCATLGDMYGMSEKMAIYRRLESGWVLKQKRSGDSIIMIKHGEALLESFPTLILPSVLDLIAMSYVQKTYSEIKQFRLKKAFSIIRKGLTRSSLKYLKWLVIILARKISRK